MKLFYVILYMINIHMSSQMSDITLSNLISKSPNFFIGKAGCPDCTVAYEILSQNCIEFTYYPKEKYPGIVEEVKRTQNGYANFPMIYIRGNFVGDEKNLASMITTGSVYNIS